MGAIFNVSIYLLSVQVVALAYVTRPDELVKRSEDVGYTPKIFDVALLANKYAFKGLEKWAAKSLIKTMSKGHSKLSMSVRDKLYPEVLRFAVDNDYVKLEKVLTDFFLHTMKFSWKRTVDVINIAHELELDNLLGRAYFHLLSKPKYEWAMNMGDGVSLTAEHRIRLLSGFHSLVTTWEEIRSDLPPAFTHCQSCIDASDGTCKRGVLRFWTGMLKSDGVLGKEPYDVVGRLEAIISILQVYAVSCDICFEAGFDIVDDDVRTLIYAPAANRIWKTPCRALLQGLSQSTILASTPTSTSAMIL